MKALVNNGYRVAGRVLLRGYFLAATIACLLLCFQISSIILNDCGLTQQREKNKAAMYMMKQKEYKYFLLLNPVHSCLYQ
jgi:hypothetical protein